MNCKLFPNFDVYVFILFYNLFKSVKIINVADKTFKPSASLHNEARYMLLCK